MFSSPALFPARPRRNRSNLLPRRGIAAFVGTVTALSLLALPSTASASTWPVRPTGVHVAHTYASAFTVVSKRSANARKYRVYASTVKKDVYYTEIVAVRHTAALRWATSTRPSVTIRTPGYTTAPYYYRLTAVNGARQSFSDIAIVGLRPAVPTSLGVSNTAKGTYLTWGSAPATGFRVAQATNAAMTANRRNYGIRGNNHQFTPYGVAKGRTYYFQVRAINNGTLSRYSSRAVGVKRSREQSVTVMTYNILQLATDGTREAGGIISPWSERKIAAAQLIKQTNADVVAIQEGKNWVGTSPGVRQVDSLHTALNNVGADYALASTEIRYGQPNYPYVRTGNYILYRRSVYQPIGAGGHWNIGDAHWAAWQQLKNIKTGARFLFVSTHLLQGGGTNGDVKRHHETAALLADAGAKSAALKVPVVYGGDFNSNLTQRPLDGPGVAMRAARVADARLAAQAHANQRFDSMNNYMRTPLAYTLHIDYVFAPAGVAIAEWRVVINLTRGRFVGTIPSDHNPVYARVIFPY